jgi:hypothetical protein
MILHWEGGGTMLQPRRSQIRDPTRQIIFINLPNPTSISLQSASVASYW